jgi:hypothetical protein
MRRWQVGSGRRWGARSHWSSVTLLRFSWSSVTLLQSGRRAHGQHAHG